MKIVVGVTDNRWAAFLRDHGHLTEANFWRRNERPPFKVEAVRNRRRSMEHHRIHG